jgi:hypothetical protein
MSYSPASSFETTIASGATLSDAVDLGQGWDHISVEIPTMASGTDIYFQAANENSGNGVYRRFHHRITNSNDTPVAMSVDSSITNCFVPLEFVRYRYLKIELSTAMTATSATFHFICS